MEQRFCGKCGSQLDKKTGLCPKCDSIKTKSSNISIVVIVLLIFALIIGGTIFAWKSGIISTKQDSNTVTISTIDVPTVQEEKTVTDSTTTELAESTTEVIVTESRYLVDDIGLFTDKEKFKLIKRLDAIKENHHFDIVIHTTNTFNGKSAMEYADDYYDYNGYGYGENHDGCILVINMESRDWYLSTCGYGIEVFTHVRMDNLGKQFAPELTNENYYDAMVIFLDEVENYLQLGEER